MTSSGHDPAIRPRPDRRRRRRPRGARHRRRPVAAPVRLPATEARAVLRRDGRARPARRSSASPSRWSSPGSRPQVVAGGDPAGLDRLVVILLGAVLSSRPSAASSRRTCSASSASGSWRQLRGDLFGRLVTLSLDFHAGRRVGELVSRLSSDVTLVRTMLTQTVTSLLSSVIGLVGSVDHPVHAQPDAAARRAAPGARADRGGDRLRPAAPAGQHGGPGHDRAEHDDRRGGAVGHPRRQELRARGLGARALRRGPAERRRDRLAARAVAGGVRRADGPARVRGPGRAALVHRPPGHRRRRSGSAR